MRVLVFGPNAGMSVSTGGGSNFTLKLVRFLLEEGHTVGLAGFHSLRLPQLISLHGVDLPHAEEQLTLHHASESDRLYSLASNLPVRLSPYLGLTSGEYERWITHVLGGWKHDVVIFQDDVPNAAAPVLREGIAYLYCHYPFRARRGRVASAWRPYLPPLETIGNEITALTIERHLVPDPSEYLNATWVNSTMTDRAVGRVWPHAKPIYLPTYVESPFRDSAESVAKESGSVIALGSIQRMKNYRTLIPGFASLRGDGRSTRLTIAGGVRDPMEARYLTRLVKRHRLEGRIRIISGLDHQAVRGYLRGSEVIVHPAIVEPFGLALLEGMAYGCAAVSFQGELAGGWTDILDRGGYGLGFTSPESLTNCFDRLFDRGPTLARQSQLALRRAETFSKERFYRSLRAHMN